MVMGDLLALRREDEMDATGVARVLGHPGKLERGRMESSACAVASLSPEACHDDERHAARCSDRRRSKYCDERGQHSTNTSVQHIAHEPELRLGDDAPSA